MYLKFHMMFPHNLIPKCLLNLWPNHTRTCKSEPERAVIMYRYEMDLQIVFSTTQYCFFCLTIIQMIIEVLG